MKNTRLENIKWLLNQPKTSAKIKILNLKNYIDYEIKSDVKLVYLIRNEFNFFDSFEFYTLESAQYRVSKLKSQFPYSEFIISLVKKNCEGGTVLDMNL